MALLLKNRYGETVLARRVCGRTDTRVRLLSVDGVTFSLSRLLLHFLSDYFTTQSSSVEHDLVITQLATKELRDIVNLFSSFATTADGENDELCALSEKMTCDLNEIGIFFEVEKSAISINQFEFDVDSIRAGNFFYNIQEPLVHLKEENVVYPISPYSNREHFLELKKENLVGQFDIYQKFPKLSKELISDLDLEHENVSSVQNPGLTEITEEDVTPMENQDEEIVNIESNESDQNIELEEENSSGLDNSEQKKINFRKDDIRKEVKEYLDDSMDACKENGDPPKLGRGKWIQTVKRKTKVFGPHRPQGRPPGSKIPDTLECSTCNKSWNGLGDKVNAIRRYKKHMKDHEIFAKHGCSCDISFTSFKHRRRHVEIVHMGRFKCIKCPEVLASQESLDKHQTIHTQVFQCEQCGFVGRDSRRLKKHVLQNHIDPKSRKKVFDFQCKDCGKNFADNMGILNHRRKVHNPTMCTLCGKVVKMLKLHIITVHTSNSEKPVHCDLCGQGFPAKERLKVHMMTAHIRTRPFKCRAPECANHPGFNDNVNRRGHERRKHPELRQIKTEEPVAVKTESGGTVAASQVYPANLSTSSTGDVGPPPAFNMTSVTGTVSKPVAVINAKTEPAGSGTTVTQNSLVKSDTAPSLPTAPTSTTPGCPTNPPSIPAPLPAPTQAFPFTPATPAPMLSPAAAVAAALANTPQAAQPL